MTRVVNQCWILPQVIIQREIEIHIEYNKSNWILSKRYGNIILILKIFIYTNRIVIFIWFLQWQCLISHIMAGYLIFLICILF